MSELHARLAAAGAYAIVGHGVPIEWGEGIADEILPIVEELLAAEREKARAPFLALADELDADTKRADDAEPVKMDDLLRMITAARVTRHAAGRIRRAAEDAQ